MLARILTAAMPEEALLDIAIKALQEYKEQKFSSQPNVENDEPLQPLKDFLSKEEGESPKKEITQPFMQITSLLMKWKDEELSLGEIIKDTEDFEDKVKQFESIE